MHRRAARPPRSCVRRARRQCVPQRARPGVQGRPQGDPRPVLRAAAADPRGARDARDPAAASARRRSRRRDRDARDARGRRRNRRRRRHRDPTRSVVQTRRQGSVQPRGVSTTPLRGRYLRTNRVTPRTPDTPRRAAPAQPAGRPASARRPGSSSPLRLTEGIWTSRRAPPSSARTSRRRSAVKKQDVGTRPHSRRRRRTQGSRARPLDAGWARALQPARFLHAAPRSSTPPRERRRLFMLPKDRGVRDRGHRRPGTRGRTRRGEEAGAASASLSRHGGRRGGGPARRRRCDRDRPRHVRRRQRLLVDPEGARRSSRSRPRPPTSSRTAPRSWRKAQRLRAQTPHRFHGISPRSGEGSTLKTLR